MANLKNGRKFSAEFNKATEVNRQTRLLAQTPNEPVEYVDLEQVAEVVNEGMATQADLNTTNENVATNAGNIQTLQNEVDNRYTKEQTDAQISEAVNEVEQTIEEIEQTNKETYATKTGEYKELTAGFAYEILGDGYPTSEEFSFRPTGGPNRNVRDGSARIEVLKGNSVVWNQQAQQSFFSGNTSTGTTITYLSNGSIKVDVVAGTNNGGLTNSDKLNIVLGHKYFVGLDLTSVIGLKYSCLGTRLLDVTSSRYDIVEATANTIIIYKTSDVDFSFTAKLTIVDLTQMFGAGHEPDTLEQFYEMIPEGVDINAYNVGEIVDANYKAIKTTGFNQYNGTYAKVLGGVKYYLGGTYISIGYTTEKGGTTEAITIPSDKFYTPSQNGYIYAQGTDICINIAWDEYSALNGTYKPYKPFERDMSWRAKYFPNGMRSAGSVRDEIRFNSTTQKWEAVQRVGVRAYQSGDETNTAVTTDGKNTNYALATPDVKTITEDVNLAYDVADYGTEQLIVAEGAQSAPLSAEIAYENNASKLLEQIAPALDRLDAIEAILATIQASAVAVTNEEE